MIIDDLDLERVAVVEAKHHAPRTVNADRPKTRIAAQLVRPTLRKRDKSSCFRPTFKADRRHAESVI